MTGEALTNATLEQLAGIISAHDDFVICGHVSPDGDCLGSALALWHALRAQGKRATCVLAKPDPIDAALSFLPGASALVPACRYDGPVGAFIAVDVPIRSRIGGAARLLDQAACSITIDHHAADERMTAWAFVDPHAASCTMLVWELVRLLCPEPPRESALCAFTGLVTDTGSFQFQNTDARAFSTAASLVSCGIDPALVARNVMQNRSRASLELDARMVSRMRFVAEGRAVLSWVTRKDMAETGAVAADREPLVNTLRSVRGIEVACLLSEREGSVRGSLRAKDALDVSALARAHGGGGHVAAAGFTIEGGLACACETIARELEELVAEAGGPGAEELANR